ncbi:MAG: VWA domain-containing protein [Pirellulales bacterium]|nr:VWA domain-containing protein [Pirellulales bacterium]
MTWEFRDPLFLVVALAAPLVYALAARSASAVRYSSLGIPDRSPRSWRVRLARLPALLTAVAVASLAVALAGPRTPDADTKVSREGIAIMMVVDRSGSMNARDLVKDDLSVDRLAVVKEVFRQFVLGGEAGSESKSPVFSGSRIFAAGGRPDDAIGLVAFAGYADSLCPLTLDHGSLASLVEDLEIVRTRNEDGTALGDGLALAVERLRQSKAKSKVAILLTDGVNNTGAVDPLRAAELAASQNIKVYSIGAGTDGLAPFPTVDPFTGRQVLEPTYVEIDEETLKAIAERTGGRYFRATDRDSLAEVYAEIGRLERTEIAEVRYLQYTEHYAPFVVAGLSLLAVAAVANGSVFRKLP